MKPKTLLITVLSLMMITTLTSELHAQSKVLVTYFSATGNTKRVAQLIARVTGGELYEIAPAEPYTTADLDWTNKQSRSSVEMNNTSARPALDGTCGEIARYDTIYIGYPIWWYVAPRIINTFVESHDLSGKTLIPFATSGGSSIEGSVAELKETYPDLNWLDGKLLNRANENTIRKWKESM